MQNFIKFHSPNEVKVKSEFDTDTFYDGQVSSKLWLSEQLERCATAHFNRPVSIAIYGSWQGMLAFMLLVRQKMNISKIDLFDINQTAQEHARKVLDHWHFQNKISISHHTQDCNQIRWEESPPDIVINTSCEHMAGLDWWIHIPQNTLFCLQTTDMPHPTHIQPEKNLESWKKNLQLKSEPIYEGTQFTEYSTFSFHRWMLIGKKT